MRTPPDQRLAATAAEAEPVRWLGLDRIGRWA